MQEASAILVPIGYPRVTLLVRPWVTACGRTPRRGCGWAMPTSIPCGILPTMTQDLEALPPQRLAPQPSPLARAALCYVAAVVIALPLGVSGVIEEKYCAIPLAAANILLAVAMLSSKPAGSH